jgi:dihydroflavonol-4-reductase
MSQVSRLTSIFTGMIFLTGGTGLVGSHIAFEILGKGGSVRALKRKGSSTALTEKIFRFYNGEHLLKNIEWVEGDILDLGSLEDAMEGMTHVYHCAAIISFFPKERDKMLQANIEGTANVVNVAMDAGVKKFCHISSIAALGQTIDESPIDEDVWWKNDPSNSWYAISKYGAEREVWRATEEGMDVVIVNPAFIVGPGDAGKTSTEVFGVLKNGNKYYSLGVNGYVDVRDVAASAVKLMESNVKNERLILSAENFTYREFFDKILDAYGNPKTKIHAGKFSLALAWRVEKWLAKISGRRPRVTKETALSALQKNFYDGSRITQVIEFGYRKMDDTIKEMVKFYQ